MKKSGHEFGGEWGGIYRKVWWDEKEGISFAIKLYSEKISKKCREKRLPRVLAVTHIS